MFKTAAEWHAALNDLPAAILVLSVAFDLTGSALRRESLKVAGLWTLVVGSAGAIAAVISGLIASNRIEHGETVHQIMETHETLAISVTILFGILSAWRIWRRGTLNPVERPAYLAAASVGALTILWVAHLGGTIVYRHAGGIPTAALEEALQERRAGHHHGEDEEPGAADQHEHQATDTAATPTGVHTHPPGTPPHKHD